MRLFLTLLLSLVLTSSARADSDVPPLTQLISAADVVVRATVDSVAAGSGPGDTLATLSVDQVFAGSYAGTIVVAGNTTDADLHAFAAGEKVIAFLDETSAGPGTHATVAGVNGVAEIVPGTETGADGLVAAAVSAGSAFGLLHAEPYLRLPTPAPRVLVSAALESLTSAVGAADHDALVGKACDATGYELAATRLWAIERVGDLDPTGGRACLRSILLDGAAMLRAGSLAANPYVVAAIAAFGNIGNSDETTASVGELLDLSLKSKPADVTCRIVPSYMDELALAAGESGSIKLAGKLYRATKKFPDLGFGSTVVHSLGEMNNAKADRNLERIASRHPDERIRQQATATLTRSRTTAAR